MADLRARLKMLERRLRVLSPTSSSSTPSTGTRPLTGEALAARLGVSAETVRRWASLGMPSCGTHPSRPTWPVYDEGACRAWAGANQPQTALRPATGEAGAAAPEGGEGESLGDLRAMRLRLQCQLMRMRLVDERARLIDADEARVAMKRHADEVRRVVRSLPAEAAARLAAVPGMDPKHRAGMQAILAREVELVLEELRDDPLAPVPA